MNKVSNVGACSCAWLKLLLFIVSIAAPVVASAFTFSIITDTSTSVPGGVGTFTSFGSALVHGNEVVFVGNGTNGEHGIYKSDGVTPAVIADLNTTAPGGAGSFTTFSHYNLFSASGGAGMSVDGQDVVFIANTTNNGPGIYKYSNNVIAPIVTIADIHPVYGTPFDDFLAVSADDGQIIFSAAYHLPGDPAAQRLGIFQYVNGSAEVVADSSAASPVQMDFAYTDQLVNGMAALFGLNQIGIGYYKHDGSDITAVAAAGTVFPGGTITGGGSGFFSYDGQSIVFGDSFTSNSGSNLNGIFLSNNSAINLVVDTNTGIPGTASDTFDSFSALSINNDRLIFHGQKPSSNLYGIYFSQNELMLKIIDSQDVLDSKPVESISLGDGSESLIGDLIPLIVGFEDGTSAVYLADLGTGQAAIEFTAPINDVAVNSLFQVQIEAKLPNGLRDTNFNHDVQLSTNNTSAKVSPGIVEFVNGIATVDVSIDSADDKTVLTASYQSLVANSNEFQVTDPAATPTELLVILTDADGNAFFDDATVSLVDSNKQTIAADPTSGNGYHRYRNLEPGIYNILATSPITDKAGRARDVEVIASQVNRRYLRMLSTDKPPVLIIPGFMGSTKEGWGGYSEAWNRKNTYPRLSGEPPMKASKLNILNGWSGIIDLGFEALEDDLKGSYAVYSVPWDWRMSIECPFNDFGTGVIQMSCITAWAQYLMSAIEDAKDPDGDDVIDHQKVHVIAHSMGGLMTRAYIQSDIYRDRGDIDKFAMLGVPNMGSTNSYYLVQGGDPWKTDNIHGKCRYGKYEKNYSCTFSSTTNYLYESKYGGSPFDEIVIGGEEAYTSRELIQGLDREDIVKFYADEILSGEALLPTYKFLSIDGGALTELSNHKNTFLQTLNNPPNGKTMSDYYIAEGEINSGGKVRAKVFASTGVSTTKTLYVENPKQPGTFTPDAVYKDGEPTRTPGKDLNGDGTVLVCSSAITCPIGASNGTTYNGVVDNEDLGWSTLCVQRNDKHSQITMQFRDEVLSFLDADSDIEHGECQP